LISLHKRTKTRQGTANDGRVHEVLELPCIPGLFTVALTRLVCGLLHLL
jgi:hypothetical protein